MTKRILVIDDDLSIRKSFVLALSSMPYDVDTAESGEKGIEMERKSRYDLIFLDLKMPGINGVETLRRLRKTAKETPVYIVTAFHKEFFGELKEAAADGIDFEVLSKPIGIEQITLVTRTALENPEIF